MNGPFSRAQLGEAIGVTSATRLKGIAVPTLCLAAEHDQAAPPAVMSRMASLIPQAQSQCLPGLGHLMNLENPSAFAKAVFDFLETHFP